MNILHFISDLIIRYLPKKRAMVIRNSYFSFRRKLTPLLKWIYGTYTVDELRLHLQEQIGSDYDILMVHGSINHMLPMYTGTPLELVHMLMEFCAPNKTLVMPAFYFGDPKIGSVTETFTARPEFNLKRSPSQMGLMTELFRRSKGVIQSRHPVYRVAAFGPLAKELVSGHENASGPAGFGSPFEYMAAHNTMVIGIGKSFHVMTQVHHVDELMGEDFPIPRTLVEQRKKLDVIVIDGKEEIPVTLPSNGILWNFNIAKLPKLLRQGDLKCWNFHHTPLFAGRAKEVTESLVIAAKNGKTLYDPV